MFFAAEDSIIQNLMREELGPRHYKAYERRRVTQAKILQKNIPKLLEEKQIKAEGNRFLLRQNFYKKGMGIYQGSSLTSRVVQQHNILNTFRRTD